jgi:hypothetical protein
MPPDVTHVLRIEVPLDMSEEEHNGDVQRAFTDALRICLGLSRVAYRGTIAGDVQVEVVDIRPGA